MQRIPLKLEPRLSDLFSLWFTNIRIGARITWHHPADWATYRPCHLASPSCCGHLLPVPSGYEFFLYPGCAEGPGGSCCKSSCNGCNGCGGK